MRQLLRAVVELQVARFSRLPDAIPPTTQRQWHAALVGFGANLMRVLNQPEVLSSERMMLVEARQDPTTTDLFYEAAYERTLEELAARIDVGCGQGWVDRVAHATACRAAHGNVEGLSVQPRSVWPDFHAVRGGRCFGRSVREDSALGPGVVGSRHFALRLSRATPTRCSTMPTGCGWSLPACSSAPALETTLESGRPRQNHSYSIATLPMQKTARMSCIRRHSPKRHTSHDP